MPFQPLRCLNLVMQVLSAEQIREWDKFTIEHEGIASVDLMERAAAKCVQWLTEKNWPKKQFLIFCGKGNNGGDGLAIARMLLQQDYRMAVFVLEAGKAGSSDFKTNLERLQQISSVDVRFIKRADDFPVIEKDSIVIDALFGSGLNKPLEGLAAQTVEHINDAGATVVSIDLPSGLAIERSSKDTAVVKATFSLTFQCYKTGLLVQDNAAFVGEVQVLDIGLHPDFLKGLQSKIFFLDEAMIRERFKPRQRFAHKGNFGHALVIGGSWGKMGAAVLAAKACLGSGAGLTTAFIPKCGYQIMQVTTPEAMVMTDEEERHLTSLPDDIEKFTSIGIGPGIGTHSQTQHLLSFVLRRYNKPIVIDADGLNCLAMNGDWLSQLPSHSVLTPHPKEFDRLFGEHQNDFERLEKAAQKAKELQAIILLKGHHTFVACPEGEGYFNSAGNAGMAKGGSGDVLTGIITSLLGQDYSPKDAVLLGVYIHGRAGDIAANTFSKEAMLPTHTIDCLSDVFQWLNAVPIV